MDEKIKISITMTLEEANWLFELLLIEEDFPWAPFFDRVRNTVNKGMNRYIENFSLSDEERWQRELDKIEWDSSKLYDYAYRAKKGKLSNSENIEWIKICQKYTNSSDEFLEIVSSAQNRAISEVNPFREMDNNAE